MNEQKQKTDLNENLAGNPITGKKSKVNKIFTTIDLISFITLSFVVFGILTLGFLVAPVLFKDLNPRPLASAIMSDIFNRYYPLAFYSIMITTAVELLRVILRYKKLLKEKVLIFNFLIIVAIAFLTSYSNFVLLPAINEMRLHQNSPTLWTDARFISIHKQSENYAKAIFMLGLIPLCFIIVRKKADE